MTVHFPERLEDRGTGMLRMQLILPLKRAQQLIPDRVIMGMAKRPQACPVQCFGSALQLAEHGIPLCSQMLYFWPAKIPPAL